MAAHKVAPPVITELLPNGEKQGYSYPWSTVCFCLLPATLCPGKAVPCRKARRRRRTDGRRTRLNRAGKGAQQKHSILQCQSTWPYEIKFLSSYHLGTVVSLPCALICLSVTQMIIVSTFLNYIKVSLSWIKHLDLKSSQATWYYTVWMKTTESHKLIPQKAISVHVWTDLAKLSTLKKHLVIFGNKYRK